MTRFLSGVWSRSTSIIWSNDLRRCWCSNLLPCLVFLLFLSPFPFQVKDAVLLKAHVSDVCCNLPRLLGGVSVPRDFCLPQRSWHGVCCSVCWLKHSLRVASGLCVCVFCLCYSGTLSSAPFALWSRYVIFFWIIVVISLSESWPVWSWRKRFVCWVISEVSRKDVENRLFDYFFCSFHICMMFLDRDGRLQPCFWDGIILQSYHSIYFKDTIILHKNEVFMICWIVGNDVATRRKTTLRDQFTVNCFALTQKRFVS
jgi:hypothetical protein